MLFPPLKTRPIAATASFALAAAAPGLAQCPSPPALIQGSDLQTFTYFGASVAMDTTPSGTMLVTGSDWRHTPGVGRTGAVSSHLKSGGTWTETAILRPADLLPLDGFGSAVAYDDPYLIVGANGVDLPADESGAVYFFERSGTGWTARGRSISLQAPAGTRLGSSVAVTTANGGWAVAGGPYRPNGSIVEAGAAYLYQRQASGNWNHVGVITDDASSDGGHWQELGRSVAIAGDVLVIGAPVGRADYGPASISGYIKVYRYQNGSWVASGPARWDAPRCCGYFGDSVATDGTYIVVGAPRVSSTAALTPMTGFDENAGCAFVYRWNSGTSAWDLDGTLFPQTRDLTYDNAQQVKLSGGKVFISNTDKDRVYQFRRVGPGNWVQETAHTIASAPGATGRFADAFAVAGSTIAISDDYHESPIQLCGAIFAFDIPTASGNDACDGAKPVAAGTYTGCTSFATADGWSTCGQPTGINPGPDMWYAYTPACSQNVVIDTIGSDYDTILSVHTGCPDLSVTHTVICNDDAGGAFGQDSMVSFNTTAGVRYLIRVSGYNGASGDYTLRIAEFPATPANNACSNPTTVSDGGVYAASTCAATTDGPATGACGPTMVKDIWYRFTPPSAGTLTLDTCGSSFDTMIALYPGATCPGAIIGEVACNDDLGASGPCPNTTRSLVSLAVASGIPHLIRVGGWNGASGDLTLNVNFDAACPCDWNHSGALSVQDIFDFLAAYFSGSADFNASGATTVQDIFDFLACYFAGCS